VKRAVGQQEEIARLREYLESEGKRGDIVGKHPSIVELHNLIESVADTDASVLIQGESGTGKELVATRIHDLSSRTEKPFVTVNCAAFPETLLESELFGHVRGAFTGAVRDKKGCFERADRGTIFLDEIGEIPPTAQVKLLRVLQFHEFQRLGDERVIRVDIRVIAATSRDLKEEMATGNFREDLYYRLHVIPIELPPLRDRMSDLALLCDSFIRKLRDRTGKPVLGIEPAAFDVLMEYPWPGNIRELENVMEHSFILAKSTDITKKDLPGSLWKTTDERAEPYPSLHEHEKDYLVRVLEHCGGNKKKAAKMLQISRSTLYRKIEAYGLK
jgi:two-component system response regulator HydG